MKIINAQVARITPLTSTILQLILVPDEYIDYQAGQYLQIISGQEAYSYSIANAPDESRQYELHIRHADENPYNQPLLAEIKQKGSVRIQLPLGTCDVSHLHPDKPILFIAGGTGFAPIKAMIEQLLAIGAPRAFELFWGARSQSDLYLNEVLSLWQKQIPQFSYFSQLSDASNATLASKVIEQHAHDLKDWQIVISGPFDMVYNVRDQLLAKGALANNLFSDAFEGEQ